MCCHIAVAIGNGTSDERTVGRLDGGTVSKLSTDHSIASGTRICSLFIVASVTTFCILLSAWLSFCGHNSGGDGGDRRRRATA